jgi:hypothetical protein
VDGSPTRTRNDLSAALVRFCVAIEEHRRTPEGRFRTPAQFLEHFFVIADGAAPEDRIFIHMPKEVRGPLLSKWGIRGAKAAVRDDDAKVVLVVGDALGAGDLDADAFEAAIEPSILLAWVPLGSFWSFWRAGAVNRPALLKAFTTAYELRLLDARAFFDGLRSRGGELTSTDVLGNAFTKDELIDWVRRIHNTGDGSPKGLLEAASWEKIVQKAPTEALLGALDALAVRLGLAQPSARVAPTPAAATSVTAIVNVDPKASAPPETAEEATPSSDLAKTGPYASPSSLHAQKPAESEGFDEDDDDSEQTKLYRQRPLLR